jgi:hypothetical protein
MTVDCMYICRSCGCVLNKQQLDGTGGHTVDVCDWTGYPTPERCGPVDAVPVFDPYEEQEKESSG